MIYIRVHIFLSVGGLVTFGLVWRLFRVGLGFL